MGAADRTILNHENDNYFFGNFDHDLVIIPLVFMKKEYICQKDKFAIWNMHGKNEIFLWNNPMEKHVSFVYDEYNRHKIGLVCNFAADYVKYKSGGNQCPV